MHRYLLLALFLAAAPAAAQDAAGSQDDLNLPNWASPSPSTSDDTQGDGTGTYATTYATAPPELPSDPDPVPVDGGLSLLALAGAGYAAHRLRRREDDEADA